MSKLTRKALLEQQIEDLEDSLGKLKEQLKKVEEENQHELIENLEDYFSVINNRFANLQGFWHLLKEELKEMHNKEKNGL
ncbi:MAG: hypothetical protein U9N52_05840 [Campylobacterota bacterium]|nr:hypothetical protein [Campylobacterota bacterium]